MKLSHRRRLFWPPVAAVLVGVGASLAPAYAQPGPPVARTGAVAGMATRTVSKFLGIERALQEALATRTAASVKPMLAPDFELRTASSADPVGADDWLRRELAGPARERIVRDLAVRELDDLAVVSFLLEPVGPGRRGRGDATLFVVDVWRQSSGKLLSRYVEQPATSPARRSRPSGRE